MTTNILSPHWRGLRANPIDPETMPFKVAEAPVFDSCDGCLFVGQRTKVCNQAGAIALAAGGFDCESLLPNGCSLIYVADVHDPRQIDLLKEIK